MRRAMYLSLVVFLAVVFLVLITFYQRLECHWGPVPDSVLANTLRSMIIPDDPMALEEVANAFIDLGLHKEHQIMHNFIGRNIMLYVLTGTMANKSVETVSDVLSQDQEKLARDDAELVRKIMDGLSFSLAPVTGRVPAAPVAFSLHHSTAESVTFVHEGEGIFSEHFQEPRAYVPLHFSIIARNTLYVALEDFGALKILNSDGTKRFVCQPWPTKIAARKSRELLCRPDSSVDRSPALLVEALRDVRTGRASLQKLNLISFVGSKGIKVTISSGVTFDGFRRPSTIVAESSCEMRGDCACYLHNKYKAPVFMAMVLIAVLFCGLLAGWVGAGLRGRRRLIVAMVPVMGAVWLFVMMPPFLLLALEYIDFIALAAIFFYSGFVLGIFVLQHKDHALKDT